MKAQIIPIANHHHFGSPMLYTMKRTVDKDQSGIRDSNPNFQHHYDYAVNKTASVLPESSPPKGAIVPEVLLHVNS